MSKDMTSPSATVIPLRRHRDEMVEPPTHRGFALALVRDEGSTGSPPLALVILHQGQRIAEAGRFEDDVAGRVALEIGVQVAHSTLVALTDHILGAMTPPADGEPAA